MLENILDRRSIRRYTSEPVTDNEIRAILECAMQAPSAMDARPWQFVVVDDRDTLNTLSDNHPYAKMLREAPMCICVCGVQGQIKDYYQQDCAAATMNILIAARELGLASCWMGVAPREERMAAVRRVLGIPENVMPFNLIALGHPAEEIPRPDRWDPGRIHKNRW